ncbi:MAG: hypothetical protein V7L26_14970 [Nostoc sp.]|uniref:hypothetical protein n=1 Tax=Nostoc sp. TaxID=1180 RepID=UPI002FEEAA56
MKRQFLLGETPKTELPQIFHGVSLGFMGAIASALLTRSADARNSGTKFCMPMIAGSDLISQAIAKIV